VLLDVRQREVAIDGPAEILAPRNARQRVARIGTVHSDRARQLFRLRQPHGRPALVTIPDAQRAAVRTDVPRQQAVARQLAVRADALAVLEQEVATRTVVGVVAIDRTVALDRRNPQLRGVRIQPLDTHPAELLLLPRAEV